MTLERMQLFNWGLILLVLILVICVVVMFLKIRVKNYEIKKNHDFILAFRNLLKIRLFLLTISLQESKSDSRSLYLFYEFDKWLRAIIIEYLAESCIDPEDIENTIIESVKISEQECSKFSCSQNNSYFFN